MHMKQLLLFISFGILLATGTAERLCTDKQVSESFAPCGSICPQYVKYVCGAINGVFCFKKYTNECYLKIAQCKNRDIKQVPCNGKSPAGILRQCLAVLNPYI